MSRNNFLDILENLEGDNIDVLVKREKEITKEINQGNTQHLQEALGIAYKLSTFYEPCEKCNFISRNKETNICKQCEE